MGKFDSGKKAILARVIGKSIAETPLTEGSVEIISIHIKFKTGMLNYANNGKLCLKFSIN